MLDARCSVSVAPTRLPRPSERHSRATRVPLARSPGSDALQRRRLLYEKSERQRPRSPIQVSSTRHVVAVHRTTNAAFAYAHAPACECALHRTCGCRFESSSRHTVHPYDGDGCPRRRGYCVSHSRSVCACVCVCVCASLSPSASRPALAAVDDDEAHEAAASLLIAADEVLKSQPNCEEARLRRAEALVLCSRYDIRHVRHARKTRARICTHTLPFIVLRADTRTQRFARARCLGSRGTCTTPSPSQIRWRARV